MKNRVFAWLSNLVDVRTADVEQHRRGRLLSILILSILVATILLTLLNVGQFLTDSSAQSLSYVVSDLATLGIVLGIWWLNHTGRTQLAS